MVQRHDELVIEHSEPYLAWDIEDDGVSFQIIKHGQRLGQSVNIMRLLERIEALEMRVTELEAKLGE